MISQQNNYTQKNRQKCENIDRDQIDKREKGANKEATIKVHVTIWLIDVFEKERQALSFYAPERPKGLQIIENFL